MKKYLALLLALTMVFMLCACGKKNGGDATDAENTETTGNAGEDESTEDPFETDPTETTETEPLPFYGTVHTVNGETDFILKGIKLAGDQHPAEPEKKPAMRDVSSTFFLDETITFYLDTDFTDYASEKAAVYIIQHRDFDDYNLMTLDDIISESVFNATLTAADSEGRSVIAELPSEYAVDGNYDIIFIYENIMTYYLTVDVQPSLNENPDAIQEGPVDVIEPAIEEETDNEDI